MEEALGDDKTGLRVGEQLFDTPNCALVVTVVAFPLPGAEIVNPKSCCIRCHYTAARNISIVFEHLSYYYYYIKCHRVQHSRAPAADVKISNSHQIALQLPARPAAAAAHRRRRRPAEIADPRSRAALVRPASLLLPNWGSESRTDLRDSLRGRTSQVHCWAGTGNGQPVILR